MAELEVRGFACLRVCKQITPVEAEKGSRPEILPLLNIELLFFHLVLELFEFNRRLEGPRSAVRSRMSTHEFKSS